jgi:hypothetical protein
LLTAADRWLGHVGGTGGEDELSSGVAASGSSLGDGRGPSSVSPTSLAKPPEGGAADR